MKQPKTLYVTDLDGTLLDSSARLSAYATEQLNHMIKSGLHFTVATARTAATAKLLLSGLHLRMPAVLMNGVLIYDINREATIRVLTIPIHAAEMILRVLKELRVTGLAYEQNGEMLTTYYESLTYAPLHDFVRERERRFNKPFTYAESFSDILSEHLIHFTLLDTREALYKVREALSRISDIHIDVYQDIYHAGQWFLEIFSADASKQNGTQYLKDKYGFERVVGFGDNINDLPLFKACDVKIAVKNAHPDLLAAADYICEGNDDDGVIQWLSNNITNF